METSKLERSETNGGAILNTDKAALEGYKRMKKTLKNASKVEELEKEIIEMKTVLYKILERLD